MCRCQALELSTFYGKRIIGCKMIEDDYCNRCVEVVLKEDPATKLKNIKESLKTVGIDMKANGDHCKSIKDIIEELSIIWENIGEVSE